MAFLVSFLLCVQKYSSKPADYHVTRMLKSTPEIKTKQKKILNCNFFLSVAPMKNSAEGNTVFVCNERKGSEEQVDTHLQWQLNLLTHIENVQNEVTSRMDLIEKEVDGNCIARLLVNVPVAASLITNVFKVI